MPSVLPSRRSGRLAALSLFTASALTLSTPAALANDAGAAIVGGVVGFALGVMAAGHHGGGHGVRRHRTARAARPSRPAVVVVRADPVLVQAQTALKWLGLYKGAVDGLNGPGTRRAVSALQQQIDEPVTGALTQAQFDALMKVYANRDQPGNGGGGGGTVAVNTRPGIDQLFDAISRTPDDGRPATVVPASTGPAATAPADTADTADDAPGPTYADVCLGSTALKAADANAAEQSLRQHFCRTFARAGAASEAAIATNRDVDMKTVLDQCGKVRDGLEDAIGDVAVDDPKADMDKLKGLYAALAGEARAKASDAFLVCVGAGLNARDPSIVDAAGLALGALDQPAYVEFVAASLALGLDEDQNRDAAIRWYRYLAAAAPAAAAGDGGPALTAEDAAAFGVIAATLTAPGPLQVANAESLLVPQFGAGKTAPATTGPLVPANTVVAAVDVDPPVKAPGAHAYSNADLAARIKDSIVVIVDPTEGTAGTGFMIGPTYILTNTHVVENADRVVVASRRFGVRAAKVIARGMTADNVGIDAAVLETVNWSADVHLSFNQGVREGEAVAIGGFPGRASKGFDRSSDHFYDIILQNRIPTVDDIPAPKFDFGFVQSVFTKSDTGLRNIQEGLETSPGNSGSPVTNACGEVVGLHYQGSVAALTVQNGQAFGDTSKFGYAITSDEVLKFLRSVNIRFDEAKALCGS